MRGWSQGHKLLRPGWDAILRGPHRAHNRLTKRPENGYDQKTGRLANSRTLQRVDVFGGGYIIKAQ
jgi:hypothetical protein